MSNAVYHRSYQIHEPITVTITPEKMEILSLPGPDRSITDENLENRVLVSKRYRNRRIGDFLKELDIVEGSNTGVPLIISSMENNGSGLPVFETDEERSYFMVTLPIHPLFINRTNETEHDDFQKRIPLRRKRDDLRSQVLELLRQNGNMSSGEIATSLGYKKVSNTLRDIINNLLASGEVVYLYPDKPNSRNQKICIKKE